MATTPAPDIDTYIAGFPEAVKERLQQVRSIIHMVAPEAAEAIKYGIPTFVQEGNMISFAGYKKHVGIYPAPFGSAAFEAAMAPYRTAKATLQFPLDRPMPLPLIKKIVIQRVKQYMAKAGEKKMGE